MDAVIKNPQHPYTRLLIDSIPWPDINMRWGSSKIQAKEGGYGGDAKGCRFVNRCPFAMPKCGQEVPRLFQVGPNQAAACFLYEDKPPLPKEGISTLFTM